MINVWGGFSAHGRTPLVRIEGRFNQHVYRNVIDSVLLPDAKNEFGDDKSFVLQEDHCGPHRAITIKDYLAEKEVTRMKWPAQSPDLNPIENVWGYLKQQIRKRRTYPKNKDDLFAILSKLWDELPQEYLMDLACTMSNRVLAVEENKGRHTKY